MAETGVRPKPAPHPVILAWVLLTALTNLPYLRASLDPPPGHAFLGFFYYVDDAYNYLSYVQQAEDGAFLFGNKLALEEHAPALINLEWWCVGRLSAALGHRPALAYRLFGMGLGLAFMLAADRWLRAAGLPDSHRFPALLLVFTGGGLGGIRFALGGVPFTRCLDLLTGLFPFVELLANPHFVAGTTLSLWTLWVLFEERSAAGAARGVLLGSLLGLVRPYDLVLVVGIRTLAVFATVPAREAAGRLVPLLGLAPTVAYNYYIFYCNPHFALLSRYTYPIPPRGDFFWALGPALLLAVALWRTPPPATRAREAVNHLLAWLALGALVMAVPPESYSLQFLVGLGLPLLTLGAVGLGRLRPEWTVLAATLFPTTAAVALRVVLSNNSRWFVPAERYGAALALRDSCRPGDVLLAPADIGLYSIGLTRCKAYLSHEVAPDSAARDEELRSFYLRWDATARASLLDRRCITQLVLPGDPGPVPRGWLGEATPFRLVGALGRGPSRISLYAREDRKGCSDRQR